PVRVGACDFMRSRERDLDRRVAELARTKVHAASGTRREGDNRPLTAPGRVISYLFRLVLIEQKDENGSRECVGGESDETLQAVSSVRDSGSRHPDAGAWRAVACEAGGPSGDVQQGCCADFAAVVSSLPSARLDGADVVPHLRGRSSMGARDQAEGDGARDA